MNHLKLVLVFSFLAVVVYGRPQSASEIARGVKNTEQIYYNSDAPDLIPFDNPQHIDKANDEFEGYGSKIYSIWDGAQQKTSVVFNSQPVHNNLKESDKYGNTGDQLKGAQNLLVGALAGVSNILNAVVDAPGNIATSVITSANKVLNQIGGKIVGIAK